MNPEHEEPMSLLELSDRERRIIAAALCYLSDNHLNNEDLVRTVEGHNVPHQAWGPPADKIMGEIEELISVMEQPWS